MRLSALASLAALALAAPALAEDVETLWSKKCSNCHGDDGTARTKMGVKHKVPDMTAAQWHSDPKHTNDFIRDVITNGVKDTKMKGYADKLTKAEIDALVQKVRSFKPQP